MASTEQFRGVRGNPARRRFALLATGVIGALVFLGGGLAAAMGLFTAKATVSGDRVSTAVLEIEAGTSGDSVPIFASGLLPGDEASTRIDVRNTGDADVTYLLRLPRGAGDSGLESALQVTVSVGTLTETRSLTDWQSGVLQVGTVLATGSADEIAVDVALPAGADGALQGLTAAFHVRIDAVQARHMPAPVEGWVDE